MRNPILVGERVYLRPVEKEDAELMAIGAAEENEFMMQRWRIPASPIAWEQWVVDMHKSQPPEEFEVAVCLREDDKLIGTVGLFGIDYVNRTAETGSWMIFAEHRSKGYGTEAKHLLLEYAFDRLQLHVLYSWVWEPNKRSAAALMKQGYSPAGRLKRQELMAGVYYDGMLFDIKREEWLAAREAWMQNRAQKVQI